MLQPQISQSMEGTLCMTIQWLPPEKPSDYSLLHVHVHTPLHSLMKIRQEVYHGDETAGDHPCFSVDKHIQLNLQKYWQRNITYSISYPSLLTTVTRYQYFL